MKCYAIFDEKLGEFMNPMFFPSSGVMTRSISQAVNKPESTDGLRLYPSDFRVHHIVNTIGVRLYAVAGSCPAATTCTINSLNACYCYAAIGHHGGYGHHGY